MDKTSIVRTALSICVFFSLTSLLIFESHMFEFTKHAGRYIVSKVRTLSYYIPLFSKYRSEYFILHSCTLNTRLSVSQSSKEGIELRNYSKKAVDSITKVNFTDTQVCVSIIVSKAVIV